MNYPTVKTMNSLTKIGLVLGLVACGGQNLSGAGFPVIDVAAVAQAYEQFLIAKEQLNHAITELERLGDPKAIKTPSAQALLQSLALKGEGVTLADLQAAATGLAGTQFDANGIFRPPQETLQTADGRILPRVVEEYRKFDAVNQSIMALEEVMQDTETRRQSIRQQIQLSLKQLQLAPTIAEVQKLQAVLAGQNAELGAIDRERDAALGRVVAQQVQNQTDAVRQQQARRENVEAGMQQATEKLGTALEVDSSPVRIPNPFGR